jgi:hypothetical protein
MRESFFQTFNMQTPSTTDSRIAEFAKLIETKGDIASLQQHLKEVIEGDAFKGSHRSGQFLQYIIDQAIAGHFDSLKERVIGMELFGRSPSYDTGDDAIVRVTASDVRKRLLQHYGRYGVTSEFRISLPSGSYIPEITRGPIGEAGSLDELTHIPGTALKPDGSSTTHQESAPVPVGPVAGFPTLPHLDTTPSKNFSNVRWLVFGTVALALNLALWGILWNRPLRRESLPISVLPWSALFSPTHATHLITSDPTMVDIQEITGSQISVSDYANRNYIPEPNKLTPDKDMICHLILRGENSAAAVDAPIAVSISGLSKTNSTKMDVHAARSIQFTDLKTEDNFIFLGSPKSDPWFSLFSDQLDFRFVFDSETGQEIIRNVHPRPNEQQSYIPTAIGGATGDSFAIIALVRNPDQNGQVLLLAGANSEGTGAAGRLATDLPRFSDTLHQCGIPPSGPIQHFEILLHLNTMAGSPNKVDVVACHILPGAATH